MKENLLEVLLLVCGWKCKIGGFVSLFICYIICWVYYVFVMVLGVGYLNVVYKYILSL